MRLLLAALSLAIALGATAVRADDRHAGYYYPAPGEPERYPARSQILADVDREARLLFVAGIIQEIAANPYPPTYAMFAKGADAEKLIIVAVQDGFYDTLYRARALFAALTSLARATPLIQEFDAENRYTFFDLCYMLGFKQLTITDGRDFVHQVVFEAPSLSNRQQQANPQ